MERLSHWRISHYWLHQKLSKWYPRWRQIHQVDDIFRFSGGVLQWATLTAMLRTCCPEFQCPLAACVDVITGLVGELSPSNQSDPGTTQPIAWPVLSLESVAQCHMGRLFPGRAKLVNKVDIYGGYVSSAYPRLSSDQSHVLYWW